MRRALVLFVVVASVGCGRPPTGDTKPAAPAERVAADDLLKAYTDDASAAAAKYGGKDLLVTMRVDGTRQSGDLLECRHVKPDNTYVEASIPVRDASKAAKGSTVTVRGRVKLSGSSHVDLGKCDVQ
jgi:hypothetical protein